MRKLRKQNNPPISLSFALRALPSEQNFEKWNADINENSLNSALGYQALIQGGTRQGLLSKNVSTVFVYSDAHPPLLPPS